jgi:hypothetical protein
MHFAVAVADRARDSERKEDQRVDVARVERHVDDDVVADHLGQGRAFGLQQRRVGGDRDRLGHLANRHLHVNARRLLDLKDDALAHEALEAAGRDFHPVLPAR